MLQTDPADLCPWPWLTSQRPCPWPHGTDMGHTWYPYGQPSTDSVPVPITPQQTWPSSAPAPTPALGSQTRTRGCPSCVLGWIVLHLIPASQPSLQYKKDDRRPWRTAGFRQPAWDLPLGLHPAPTACQSCQQLQLCFKGATEGPGSCLSQHWKCFHNGGEHELTIPSEDNGDIWEAQTQRD